MRYAVISDVHANIEALQVVLAKLSGIDEIHCIGDIVGYGPNPDECCDRIKRLKGITVQGNHDAYVSESYGASVNFAGGRAARAIDKSTRYFSQLNRDWLATLPAKECQGNILFAHGNPSQSDPYCITEYLISELRYYRDSISRKPDTDPEQSILYSEDTQLFKELFNLMLAKEIDEAVFGHSHLAFAARRPKQKDNTDIELILVANNAKHKEEQEESFELELDPDYQYAFNPGSVGQPRDGDKRASCLVREGNKAIWHRVCYDMKKTAKKMEKLLIEDAYIDRLWKGK